MPSDIALITIDLDDTLWPCAPVIDAAEAELYAWLQLHAPGLTARHDHASLSNHRRSLMQHHPEVAHDITAVRLLSLQALLQDAGHGPSLAEQALALFREARNRVTPFPDVLPALASLARYYTLVSVTNGNAEAARTPVGDYFRHHYTAAEVGGAKPAPALFVAACEAAGVAPAQALHVGDDPRLDVAAARQLGMQVVWVNRYGRDWPENLLPADGVVEDLFGLEAWLRGDEAR